MNESRNPFRYSEPVPAEELLDRDQEAAQLLNRAVSGNNSRLVAPRRYGKTSLLARVAQEARGEKGWTPVYVDFFGVLTLDDIAQRIERAYVDELQGAPRYLVRRGSAPAAPDPPGRRRAAPGRRRPAG